jgi:hypothetical protein
MSTRANLARPLYFSDNLAVDYQYIAWEVVQNSNTHPSSAGASILQGPLQIA